MINSWKYP